LPTAKNDGATISSKTDVYQNLIEIDFSSTSIGQYQLMIYKKEELIKKTKINYESSTKKEKIEVKLKKDEDSNGVLRVTILDDSKTPLCERLIFNKPKRSLKIKVKNDKKFKYCPGDNVKLKISTYDSETGKKVSSVLGITVTDETVLESIEKRKQAPRMTSMVFLENDVNKLEDSNYYFSKEEGSDKAIDLLLGVQG
jgi:hypothetical protein